mmetsp:Transcript_17148/g.25602  ORF Transcript_17148/g.25602 Transcript_17148/m.25602 type:complete len:220 (+) Transcript_17148:2265-2924(+)
MKMRTIPKMKLPLRKKKSSKDGQSDLSTLMVSEEGGPSQSTIEENEGNAQQIEEEDLLGLYSSKCPPSPKVLPSPKVVVDGETKTKEVGDMVANMIHEQLKMVPFPELQITESNDSFLSCNSQHNHNEGEGNELDDKDDQSRPKEVKDVDATNKDNTEIGTSPVVSEEIKETAIDEQGNSCDAKMTEDAENASEHLSLPGVNDSAGSSTNALDSSQEKK